MKSRKYNINIPKPCHENWDEMTPTVQGKFCHNCAKNLIDFTSLSDAEIISYLENQEGKLCGRLHQSQMNRVLQDPRPSSRIRRWQKVLVSMLLMAPFTQTLAQDTPKKAQKQRTYVAPVQEIGIPTRPEGSDLKKREVKGVVIDQETGEPIFGCVVRLEGYELGAYTEWNGEFTIVIPDSIQDDVFTLRLIYIGYDENTFNIHRESLNTYHELSLEESHIYIIGTIIYKPTLLQRLSPRRLWWRVSRFWRK